MFDTLDQFLHQTHMNWTRPRPVPAPSEYRPHGQPEAPILVLGYGYRH